MNSSKTIQQIFACKRNNVIYIAPEGFEYYTFLQNEFSLNESWQDLDYFILHYFQIKKIQAKFAGH